MHSTRTAASVRSALSTGQFSATGSLRSEFDVVPSVLVAKTSLDGHWRGVDLVARVLRDAGFEVIMLGMATPESIAAVALEEDVDLVGLNVGGRVEVAERAVRLLREAGVDVPVMAGGTIAPWGRKRLEAM